MSKPIEATAGAQSLHKSLGLLRLVSSHSRDGIRLVDLCRASGITRPTAHRMLQALQVEGLIEQDPKTDRYHLGREAYLLGPSLTGVLTRMERDGLIERERCSQDARRTVITGKFAEVCAALDRLVLEQEALA